ncbi:hypothetical protein Scani_39170 [Streptomyces caniferus]|uniref:Uncharacterized protein n=1 Tax=Streptomyces caniferus TaxID=285557 RepID=A0A640S8S8_9ACTN|nr:hypothetical protein Scani_39170 [Streptomyces caniferus]
MRFSKVRPRGRVRATEPWNAPVAYVSTWRVRSPNCTAGVWPGGLISPGKESRASFPPSRTLLTKIFTLG